MGKVVAGSRLRKMGLTILAAVLCFCVAAVVAGCGGSDTSKPAETVKVNVGYWGGTSETPLFVAKEQGIFEKYGIDAEMTKITAGSAAFLANVGDAPAVFLATPNFLPMISNGMDIKYVSEIVTGCIQGCATVSSGITSVADLEGRQVGTFDTKDMGQIFLSAAMKNAGADPTKVTWVTEGNIGTMMNAADAGEVVAFCNFDPSIEIVTKYFPEKYVKIFNNATDPNFKDMTNCFLAGNNLTYSDPELAKRIAGAIDEACQWITQNPEEAAKLIVGANDSGTKYCTPSATLLSSYGVDESKADDVDLYGTLIKSYTWGNTSADHFAASLRQQWETVEAAGMLPEGRTIDELTTLCGAYCGL